MPIVQESSSKPPGNFLSGEALPADLGETIADARRKRRWSQAGLASRSKVARASVYRLEAGGHAIRPDTLFRIARALGLEMAYLVPAWPEWDPVGEGGYGPRTRERRRALGISISDLAAAAGVSEATLSRHERGLGHSARLLRLEGDEPYACNEALASALGFSSLSDFERYCRGGEPSA